MATRLLHVGEASMILPRCEVDNGKSHPPGICFKSWQARKHAPREFTPSLSGSALRGRLASAWCEKARGALFDYPEHVFDKEWETPLRFFIPTIDGGRSPLSVSDRSAGECGEKTSPLLLAFSPFLGEHATPLYKTEEKGAMGKIRNSKNEIRACLVGYKEDGQAKQIPKAKLEFEMVYGSSSFGFRN